MRGSRLLSLALNLPGPAAVQRLHAMGARCIQVLPPSGDPMAQYSPQAQQQLGLGIWQTTLDLKSATGQRRLHALLGRVDVLLTSFRPAALRRLGLDAESLRTRYPTLCSVAIVGAPGPRADEPGHDLSYQAEAGLVPGLQMPVSLLADMAGALLASEAVLQVLAQRQRSGSGAHREVALTEAAHWLALPRQWGLTSEGALLGGGHAGYRIYPCLDGRVALAALELHFAAALAQLVGLGAQPMPDWGSTEAHQAVAAFMAARSCEQLEQLAAAHDLPLHTLPAG
ncbi:predicted acyl-CoA transferase/carnitine dehydratase [Serpentinimonas raichei]|uniref:Predicted acyl-CoA transferase/carnitine dehydratase n=1 Tax=Serpentinimonas raichei TaxID=1458425 RepID=A0A060NJ07_9BURK|nr:CoA transferase [Serpentinimonas raichei]BAO82186.1 predicted acyl-CoA transferase/carnitine dehydratase [Serpentinimonas raichei]